MKNERCAIGGEADREGRGAGGAVTVPRFRPFGRALLPWAAAAAMLFGGELAAQEDPQPLTPDDPKCAVDGTTVTCTGNLSPGVLVPGDALGTYTTLYVNELDGDIAPVDGTTGIGFTGDGNITLDVNTGDYDITTSGFGAEGIKVEGSGNIDVNVTGDITTNGASSKGVSVSGTGGTVDVDVKGDITTNGASSNGVTVSGSGGKTTVEVNGNIETWGTTGSGGLYVSNDDSDIKITLTGGITVRSRDGLTGFTSNAGKIEIIVQGDITNWDSNGSGINTGSERGDIAITLNGGTIRSSGEKGIWFSSLSSDTVNNTLTVNNTVTIRGGIFDVVGGEDNETIENYGMLTTPGTINLISHELNFVDGVGAQTNVFNNHTAATYNSGASVVLGSDDEDLFANAGNLSPGGANVVQITQLTGDFENFITDENDTVEAGTLTVTIDPDELNDQLIVNGKITLNGGTVRVVGAYDKGRYTILKSTTHTIEDEDEDLTTAEAIAKVDAIDTLFMDYEVEQGDTTFEMVLVSARKFDSFCDVAGTANQRAGACNGLDGLPEANNLAQAVLTIPVNGTAQARAALDALSGEVHASLKGALTETGQTRVAAVNRRMAARSGNPDAQTSDARISTAAFGNPSLRADGDSGSWITGYGAWGETDATPGTARMETDLRGVLFGVDRALGDHWRLGVLGGYSRTDVTQRARLSSASVDTWSAGLYGGAEAGAWGLDFGAIYNGHAVDTSRTVSFTNCSPERLSARYDARSWQLFAEAGHKVQVGGLMLEPFAGVSHTGLASDGFSESGGDAALTSSSDTDNTTFTTLGLHGAMMLLDTVHVRGMAGWRHAFGDTEPSSTATLRGSTTAFTVTGAPTAEDALVAEFGIEAGLSDNAFLGVAYKGRYGDGAAAHGFNAGLRVTF